MLCLSVPAPGSDTLNLSFCWVSHHLLLTGQISLFVFPCQQPLSASKSRLNDQSMFARWWLPGQAALGAKWIAGAHTSEGSPGLAAVLQSDLRAAGSHPLSLLESPPCTPVTHPRVLALPPILGADPQPWLWPTSAPPDYSVLQKNRAHAAPARVPQFWNNLPNARHSTSPCVFFFFASALHIVSGLSSAPTGGCFFLCVRSSSKPC